MPNPYDPPSEPSGLRTSPSLLLAQVAGFAVVVAAATGGALLLGINLSRHRQSSSEDFQELLLFFASLGLIFGLGGGYLTARYIAGRIPLYYAMIALGVFAVSLPIAINFDLDVVAVSVGAVPALTLLLSVITGSALRRVMPVPSR